MKDKNGIEVKCKNCAFYDGKFCDIRETFPECHKRDYFLPAEEAYIARIAELQNSLDETEKKLTETVKLLGERSRECGELEAYNEVLQRRVQEFSMELLDQNMRDNKDVLERLKNAESEEKMNPFTENIVAWIEENQNQDLSQFLANLDICCYSTKYNEDIICIQPNGPRGVNFEIASVFSNLDRTLSQYNRTKLFTKGFLERVELLFKLHKGQTNEQLKDRTTNGK